MQITLEIPDDLAIRLRPMQEHVAEIIERGLRQHWSEATGLRREVIRFLASGPRPDDIVRYRPSQDSQLRAQELLDLARQGALHQAEEAELDELTQLDSLVSLIKAEARHFLRGEA